MRSRRTARSGWRGPWRWQCAPVPPARPSASTLLEAKSSSGVESFTIWLAEVAQAAFDIVLFVDDVECLPAESVEALAYVLRNAPPNLRIVDGGSH